MDKEIWKDVMGYEDLYQISNHGNIRSKDRTTIIGNKKRNYPGIKIKIATNDAGYKHCLLHKNGIRKHILIHRLVYQAFNGELDDTLVIDHIDNIKSNNYYKNLQQITQRENVSKDTWRNGTTSKYAGVSFISNNKWKSTIQFGNKLFHIGIFETEIHASNAYLEVLANGKTNKYKYKYTVTNKVIQAQDNQKVSIIQYDLNNNIINTYNSMSEAAKHLRLKSHGIISMACKRGNIVKGKWKFKKE